MQDYEPLYLAPWCNAAPDMFGEDARPMVGHQSFRGLPFLIGPEDGASGKCFVALDGESRPVAIPIKRKARRVIFAHRLLESLLSEGGALGGAVADYVFRLRGSGEVRVRMRERFEIGSLPPSGEPFLAKSDLNDTLASRYEGRWEDIGNRQMESIHGRPRDYYLWSWENPEPDRVVESLEIVPRGPRFIVAGITLGHLDEHPFVRQRGRETRIELTNPEDTKRPFDLEVEVDRGVTTYVHPLPEATVEEFIEDPMKGWGQAQNRRSSPSYVEIAAIPSATVSVRQEGELVGHLRWSALEEKGIVSTPRMKVELMDRGQNWVHVMVMDDDTDKPVPCRVHFRSPEGIPYQPHGHHNQVNSNISTFHNDIGGDLRLGQITYAYIDGTCQGWLPRGEVIVDVARGFEYEPVRTRVNIEPGQRELTLRIKRWIDMNSRRWYSGDSHVHFLSTRGGHLESQAEDLNVVNLLQSQWGSLFTSIEEFTGAPSVSQDGSNIIYVGQENRQHQLGHMTLWGLKRPVMPFCSDGPTEAEMGGTMETTMSHWADECHDQGGSVILPHLNPRGESAAVIATGRVDGVEMMSHSVSNHIEYYRYLNGGYRLPLVGGTDKMSSAVPVGMCRTYVYVQEDEEFTYDTWRKNVAAGRTFASSGPMIHLAVDGHQVGDTVRISGPGTVEVHAWAESIIPIERLDVVQQGRVVASSESRQGRRIELRAEVKVEGHTWLAARCGGPDYFGGLRHHDLGNRGVFAHTSPVYVACGGDWWMHSSDTAQYMLTMVEGDLAYIAHTASLAPPGSVTHRHGEADHMAFLQRPFLEAREAVMERVREAERRSHEGVR